MNQLAFDLNAAATSLNATLVSSSLKWARLVGSRAEVSPHDKPTRPMMSAQIVFVVGKQQARQRQRD